MINRKQLIVIIFLILFVSAFAEEKKINEFTNNVDESGLLLRSSIDPYDGYTGNSISFDNEGILYSYNADDGILSKYDKNYMIYKQESIGVKEVPLKYIWDCNFFVLDGYSYNFFIYDKDFNAKFNINLNYYIKQEIFYKNVYYNEENEVLFFTDNNSNIHSIINPGLNDEQNKKNYRNPEQTKELFSKDSEYGKKGLVIDGNKLFIDNIIYFWGNANINNYQYLIGRINIYVTNYITDEEVFKYRINSDDEEFESAAVHPSGDIYVLRMNWSTNTHNLYRIENTWDTEWREQWYKDHPDAM